jgi:hypothetical protein
MTADRHPPTSLSPDALVSAVEAAAENGLRTVVHVRGKAVEIAPHIEQKRSPSRRRKRFSMTDALWELRGIIDGPGPTDVSENTDRYLAEADAPTHS